MSSSAAKREEDFCDAMVTVRNFPEVDVGEVLYDELVGLSDTVDREMGASTGEKERWITRHLEKPLQLRIVSETLQRRVRRRKKHPVETILKGIYCLNVGRIAPPFDD